MRGQEAFLEGREESRGTSREPGGIGRAGRGRDAGTAGGKGWEALQKG